MDARTDMVLITSVLGRKWNSFLRLQVVLSMEISLTLELDVTPMFLFLPDVFLGTFVCSNINHLLELNVDGLLFSILF